MKHKFDYNFALKIIFLYFTLAGNIAMFLPRNGALINTLQLRIKLSTPLRTHYRVFKMAALEHSRKRSYTNMTGTDQSIFCTLFIKL